MAKGNTPKEQRYELPKGFNPLAFYALLVEKGNVTIAGIGTFKLVKSKGSTGRFGKNPFAVSEYVRIKISPNISLKKYVKEHGKNIVGIKK